MKYDTKEVIGKYIIETVFKTNKEKLESSTFCNKLFFCFRRANFFSFLPSGRFNEQKKKTDNHNFLI
jgi:hypothetical protein